MKMKMKINKISLFYLKNQENKILKLNKKIWNMKNRHKNKIIIQRFKLLILTMKRKKKWIQKMKKNKI